MSAALKFMLSDVYKDLCKRAAAVQAVVVDAGSQLQLDVLRPLQRPHDRHHGFIETGPSQVKVLSGRDLDSVGPGRCACLDQFKLKIDGGETEAWAPHGEEVLVAGHRYLHVVWKREVVEGERHGLLAALVVSFGALTLVSLAPSLVVGVPVVSWWTVQYVASVASTGVQTHLVFTPADVVTLAFVDVLASPLVIVEHIAFGTGA